MTFFNSFFSITFLGVYALSMLPPGVQNKRDLHSLLEFIKKHDAIATTLRSINLHNNTIVFGSSGECIAFFERKLSNPLAGAGDLIFVESNCDSTLKTNPYKPFKGIN